MKFDITKRMEVVDRAIESTANPLHNAILRNYRRHATLEVCGLWPEILVPEMTDENAKYRIHRTDKLVVANGIKQIAEVYSKMEETGSTVIYHTDEHIMVSDEGFMSEYKSHRFWDGLALQSVVDATLDPNAKYIVSQTLITFFTYNDRGILTGERVYHGTDREIRFCEPGELITVQECLEKLLPNIESPLDFALA